MKTTETRHHHSRATSPTTELCTCGPRWPRPRGHVARGPCGPPSRSPASPATPAPVHDPRADRFRFVIYLLAIPVHHMNTTRIGQLRFINVPLTRPRIWRSRFIIVISSQVRPLLWRFIMYLKRPLVCRFPVHHISYKHTPSFSDPGSPLSYRLKHAPSFGDSGSSCISNAPLFGDASSSWILNMPPHLAIPVYHI